MSRLETTYVKPHDNRHRQRLVSSMCGLLMLSPAKARLDYTRAIQGPLSIGSHYISPTSDETIDRKCRYSDGDEMTSWLTTKGFLGRLDVHFSQSSYRRRKPQEPPQNRRKTPYWQVYSAVGAFYLSRFTIGLRNALSPYCGSCFMDFMV